MQNKISRTYELYKTLKEMLNSEQQDLLRALDDEYAKSELMEYERGLQDGKKNGLKMLIVDSF